MRIVKTLIVALLVFGFVQDLSAQIRTKYFFIGVGAGVTNYKGDLDDNFTLKFTKPGLSLIGGYKFHPHMYARLTFNQGWMGASDEKAARDVPRRRRNLSFRSPITEGALTLHYEFFANNRKFMYRPKYSPYIFGGVALFYFNPQAKLGNDWVNLQPLGTEGQNIATCTSCPEPYSLVQISIPFGVGLRYKLSDKVDLAIEMGMRKTFTDYLDDVSNLYVQSHLPTWTEAQIRGAMGSDEAYLLADRIDKSVYPEGGAFINGIRGDNEQDDWYVISQIHATYILDWVKCPKFR